jgi:thiol:disulfide interchange protein DsbD
MESVKQFMAFPLFGTVIWLLWVVGLQTGLNTIAKVLSALCLLALGAWIYGRWRNRLSTALVVATVAIAVWTGVLGARSDGTAQAGEALKWEPYSRARLDELRSEGKPIFVDFTAAWCVTCKVNETVALSSGTVASAMKQLGMVALKADWTNADAEITKALAEQGRNGVPLYLVYPTKKDDPPHILPQILTEKLVLDEIGKVKGI